MFFTDYLKKRVDKHNLSHILTDAQYEQMLPRFGEDSKISKNIFQIYLLDNDSTADDVMSNLTPEFIDNIERLKKNNPEYAYHLLSDRDAQHFINQYYGTTIWSYYQRIDSAYLAAKADFLRYLLLYACGGIYLDLKSTIDVPLSKTLREDDRFMVFYWDTPSGGVHHYLIPDYITKGEMLQAFIVSAQGHPILRAVILNVLRQIDAYNPYRNGIGFEGTLTTVGPAIYTKTIYNIITNHCTDDGIYREGKPEIEFGYKVYFAGEYVSGSYQKTLSMKDYRKSSRPVIRCDSKLLQLANIIWLRILHAYRKIKGLPI